MLSAHTSSPPTNAKRIAGTPGGRYRNVLKGGYTPRVRLSRNTTLQACGYHILINFMDRVTQSKRVDMSLSRSGSDLRTRGVGEAYCADQFPNVYVDSYN